MATTTKLVMTFGTTEGRKNITYNHAKDTSTTMQVKTLMQAFITNGTLFLAQPLTMYAAKIVTTTEDEFDLSD